MKKFFGSKKPAPHPVIPLFGSTLEDALKRPSERGKAVPTIVTDVIEVLEKNHLLVEGLYRVSGSAVHIQRLRKYYDEGSSDSRAELVKSEPSVICGLLKQYLRELPEPLLTRTLYTAFVNCGEIDDEQDRVTSMRLLVRSIPTTNKNLLQVLVRHIRKIAEFSEINMMTEQNLSIVFAPTLLSPPPEDVNKAFTDNVHVATVVSTLIMHFDGVFAMSSRSLLPPPRTAKPAPFTPINAPQQNAAAAAASTKPGVAEDIPSPKRRKTGSTGSYVESKQDACCSAAATESQLGHETSIMEPQSIMEAPSVLEVTIAEQSIAEAPQDPEEEPELELEEYIDEDDPIGVRLKRHWCRYEALKKGLTSWSREFTAKNGREPDHAEKMKFKGHYKKIRYHKIEVQKLLDQLRQSVPESFAKLTTREKLDEIDRLNKEKAQLRTLLRRRGADKEIMAAEYCRYMEIRTMLPVMTQHAVKEAATVF
eukprot:m51a1_g3279 hypothetical protein (479) ;mRNA; r:252381-254505